LLIGTTANTKKFNPPLKGHLNASFECNVLSKPEEVVSAQSGALSTLKKRIGAKSVE